MALSNIITSYGASKTNVGGIRQMKLWEQVYTGQAATNAAQGTYAAATGNLTTFGVPTTGANVVTLKFATGTGKVDISATQEKGMTLSTISVEGYIPNMSKLEFTAIRSLIGKALMGTVEINTKHTAGTENTTLLLGWDATLATSGGGADDYLSSKFALFLDSIEASSGAAMEDGAGATLKLTAVQGDLPYSVEE